jgi:hypothetical protein
MVVVRKNISVEKGEQVLFPNERYFFYIAEFHLSRLQGDTTFAEPRSPRSRSFNG